MVKPLGGSLSADIQESSISWATSRVGRINLRHLATGLTLFRSLTSCRREKSYIQALIFASTGMTMLTGNPVKAETLYPVQQRKFRAEIPVVDESDDVGVTSETMELAEVLSGASDAICILDCVLRCVPGLVTCNGLGTGPCSGDCQGHFTEPCIPNCIGL